MLGKPAQDKALLCEVLNEVLQVSIVRDALQTVTTEDLSVALFWRNVSRPKRGNSPVVQYPLVRLSKVHTQQK